MGLNISYHVFQKIEKVPTIEFIKGILLEMQFKILSISDEGKPLDELFESVMNDYSGSVFAVTDRKDLVVIIDQGSGLTAFHRLDILKNLTISKSSFVLSVMQSDTVDLENTDFFKNGELYETSDVEGNLDGEIVEKEVREILEKVKCGFPDFFDANWIKVDTLDLIYQMKRGNKSSK
ncbi:MAG: hypothetical protein DHS20C18_35410 [Saprospiraceae bacterium]|nr:MAG: hypothetical protein DHS20C18_35410 [Saprospiraceae bacterium]